LLSNVGIPSILLLVFINGVMAGGRLFAGPIVHKFNPSGMLLFSAVVSALGLILLSYSTGWYTIPATLVFAIGVTYFWPTMLGYVAEYIPKSGALGLSIMGGAGMLTVSLVLPLMGNVYDHQLVDAIPKTYNVQDIIQALAGTQEFIVLTAAKVVAGAKTLRLVSVLPIFLVFAFLFLRIYTKKLSKR
jgi:hypothetical protein